MRRPRATSRPARRSIGNGDRERCRCCSFARSKLRTASGTNTNTSNNSDIEAGRIDRRAIQKRVADCAKLFVLPGPSRFEGPVTVEEFFSGTEEEIRYEVSRRMCVKVTEKLRQELPGVQVETPE